ncbi:MAG TPA: hypothetical protein VFE62_05475 [Gemmataceae bacterium]|nr:hypothetical protein [Gemmataceae bacterium]
MDMNLTSVKTDVPVALPAPVPPIDPVPVLSWRVAVAILLGLSGFSAGLVLLTLLVVALLPRTRVEPDVAVAVAVMAPPPASIAVESASLPREEPRIEPESMPVLTPSDEIKLARRMPSFVEPPMPMPMPPTADAPKPEPEKRVVRAPIRWAVEMPAPLKRDDTNLILPIEVARIEEGNVHYTLRRLRFPEEPKPLRLAVTPFAHDDVAGVLKSMGDGYRYTTIRNEDTRSILTLRSYDVVFLTCADLYLQDFQSALPLRKFVEYGGTLYASDLRRDQVLAAFPEFRGRMPLLPGIPQSVDASVVDEGLQEYLGRKTIPLAFNAPNWRPAAFDPAKTTVCLKGAYRNQLGETWSAPLLVKFRAGKGTVVFTSFHHMQNDSALVQKLIDYLVYASVSARSEARVKELMVRSNFAAETLRPAFVSKGKSAEGLCRHEGGPMQVALGFENLGARLKLTLRSPAGKTVEHEDQGIFMIEIPQADPGVWQYTITPAEVPHPHFPVVVAVGKAKT